MLCDYFFLLKQNTAYDVRISDWSSDVCSSDLRGPRRGAGEDRTDAAAGTAPAPVVPDPRQGPCEARRDRVRDQRGALRARPAGRGDPGRQDQKRAVWGKSVSVRVDLGGRRHIKKKKQESNNERTIKKPE